MSASKYIGEEGVGYLEVSPEFLHFAPLAGIRTGVCRGCYMPLLPSQALRAIMGYSHSQCRTHICRSKGHAF